MHDEKDDEKRNPPPLGLLSKTVCVLSQSVSALYKRLWRRNGHSPDLISLEQYDVGLQDDHRAPRQVAGDRDDPQLG